ncbi:MAG: hypothetical protein GXX10_11325 [Clostridiaceae bacterium]|nr:hypothetical protein [Clostridiaceae bacterium]
MRMLFSNLQELNNSNIINYLKRNDWVLLDDYPNKNFLCFINDEYGKIFIPSNESFADYYLRIREAILFLSEIYKTSTDEIINDIINPLIDYFSIRIISSGIKDGKIPLDVATNYLIGLKELVISSAANEENPRPYVLRASKNDSQYANLFKFAQTKVGSYIMTIETNPMDEISWTQIVMDENQCGFIDSQEEIQFPRRIMNRISTAFKQLQEFDLEDMETFLESAYIEGLNANMCDAISKFYENDLPDFNIEVNFGTTESHKKNNSLFKYRYNKESQYAVKIISEEYKKKNVTQEVQICGKVEGLKALHGIVNKEELSGFATIIGEVDGQTKKVRVFLEGKDFRLACDVLKRGKSLKVKGEMSRVGKFFTIECPTIIEEI